MNKHVIIMVGCSGSFKSTIASLLNSTPNIADSEVVSADDYPEYYEDNKYVWTSKKCDKAHQYCQGRFLECLMDGVDLIVVDNTNLTKKARQFYINEAKHAGYEYTILAILPEENKLQKYADRNTHKVSLSHIKVMAYTFYKEISEGL